MRRHHSAILASSCFLAVMGGYGAFSAAHASGSVPVWSGAYLGITGGASTGNVDIKGDLRRDHTDPSSEFVSEDGNSQLDGGMIGGLVGYDFSIGNGFVVGVLGDMSWMNANADTDIVSAVISGGSDYSVDASLDWLGTARARIGFEMGDALIYGTGGVAFGGMGVDLHEAGDGHIGSGSATQLGWALGAGINYMATDRIILGLEYLYVDLGKETYDFGSAGAADVDLDMSVIRGTISFKF